MRKYLIEVLGMSETHAGAVLQMVEHAYRNGHSDGRGWMGAVDDMRRIEAQEAETKELEYYLLEGHKSEYGTC